jgi:hypothetical protein
VDTPISAPHNALAVYVCVIDPHRVVKYPFVEGADIPRQIEKDGAVFALRSVHYDGQLDQIEQTQRRIREWNLKLFGGKPSSEAA